MLLPAWKYRKRITVSPEFVTANLTNVPVRVPLSRLNLHGHYGVDSGADIRFALPDGTPLNHIWGGFTSDNGYGADVMVSMLDSTTGGAIDMYYGNPAGTPPQAQIDVWQADVTADYVVWAPLYNFISGQLDLASGFALALEGSATAQSDGVLINDGALIISDTGDIQTGLTGKTGLTYSCVFRDMSFQAALDDFIICDLNGENYYQAWLIRPALYNVQYSPNRPTADRITVNSPPIENNADHHLAFSWQCKNVENDATLRLFADGVLSGENSSSVFTESTLSFGTPARAERLGYYQPGKSTNSVASDFRVAKYAMSPEEIKFANANFMTANNQITLGPEERLRRTDQAVLISMFWS